MQFQNFSSINYVLKNETSQETKNKKNNKLHNNHHLKRKEKKKQRKKKQELFGWHLRFINIYSLCLYPYRTAVHTQSLGMVAVETSCWLQRQQNNTM